MTRTTPTKTGRPADEEFLKQMLGRQKRLIVDRASQFGTSGLPSAEQLAQTVAFAPQDGSVWLCGQRMMLLQGSAFGSIRRELIEALGFDKARGLLTRIGWQAGARDAAQVSEQWPEGDDASLYSAGPRLHMLEGMVNVEVVRFEIDSGVGHFYSEFLWHNSLEDDEHIAAYGLGGEPACWMEIGYASGYASSLLGRLVVFREQECRAMGHQACRIVGKPADQWDDIDVDLAYLDPGDFLSRSTYASGTETSVAELEEPADGKPLVGISAAFVVATQLLQRVAPTQATVLLIGESGVGKELFARSLYQASSRQDMPLVALNCATLPENLVEAELFGVERGAFTGAERSRPGRFERAHGGTLFLDEIATLSFSAQSKILRALQEGEIERVGGTAPIRVDVRVIAATNLDLRREVEAGRFREDLFYRLNVFPIHLPPLRERREDIPLLMSYFLRHFSLRHGRHLAGFSTRLVNALLTYRFPGNIRELQNLIERGVISAGDGEVIDIVHLAEVGAPLMGAAIGLTPEGRLSTGERREDAADELRTATESSKDGGGADARREPVLEGLQAFVSGQQRVLNTSLADIELYLVRLAMERSGGNVTAAAQMLGMSRAQVSYRLKGG
ncbi:sigma-54-dependent Fis family transcriptional regulator [Pseudomonas chlororaphis]|jgi:transcriptional regulator with PAS, ATPase and Fis domain|uniref:sigma-54-dependent Fis family transcriptional regulator n=1 Tax=Pseudomonas chlororaphis TaxID=587753 RepID=UPI001B30128E|nr:sigma-54-dependent Fis family transcriptional regulator [Pseudomonas chlororaphis]MBP5059221.1 sigma 54-interacting transcriptional regulator [Pseudomonas chlororaphis]MBP5137963.1 sigma 54-interacting transcriptional regulator [Pseudomonas chlororaphis]QTT98309.1 sigma 54-interacting transcriptional regulator [Pseudomonas chlororaphis]